MNKPFFSVVIPTYNRGDDVCRAVKSVLQQTDQDFEILVVDDAGTDDTEQKLEELLDKRIKYFKQPINEGAKAARNRGIHETNGEWLCFLDSDDEWLPKRLEYLREKIVTHTDAKNTVFWSSLVFNRGNGVRYVKPNNTKPHDMPFFDYLMCHDGLMQTSTLAVHSAQAKQHPFNETVLGHDDYEFLYGLEKAGLGFDHDTRPQVIWHDDTSGTRVSFTNRLAKCKQWLQVHKNDMSPKATLAYKAQHLAQNLMGVRKIESTKIIIHAALSGAISYKRACKLLARLYISTEHYKLLVGKIK